MLLIAGDWSGASSRSAEDSGMADINAIVESLKATLKDLPVPITVVAALGALSVLGFVLQAVGAFYRFFLRGGKNLKKLGSYAVVTGATGT